MLVSIHKLIFLLFSLMGWSTVQAQNTWTLKQCLDTALRYNKTLQMNQNNIDISVQRTKEAQANLIPKVFANSEYKYFLELPTQLMPMDIFNPQVPSGQFKEAQFGVPHNISANVQLAMPLYSPQILGTIKSAKVGTELSKLQFQKSVEQVLYDVTLLYYNAQILKNQLSFLDANLQNTSKLLQNIQLLNEQLLATGTDVNKVKLQAEQLSTQKEIVLNKYVQILNALKLNMGVDMDSAVMVENNITFQHVPDSPPKINIDIRIAQTQLESLTNELQTLKQTKYVPSVSLTAAYGVSGFGYDRKPNDFLKFFPVGFAGLQLTYPIFNGTVTHRKMSQLKRHISNNNLQTQLLKEKNNMDLMNFSRQKIVAEQTVLHTQNHIALAQSIYNQTILQQKQGTASLTDILLADNSLRDAQQQYLNAVIDYLKADLGLKMANGTIKVITF